MSVCCECRVLSGLGLCDVQIIRTEVSYECLSVVTVVCYHVEVCETGCSLVQRSSMDVFL